ncbi:MAG: Isoquinoline 1-oxidoreductase [Hyphomicrobiales bacterium]|nr:Isoquinoline 1-oxidoreductase [Hyphomicrobiales bacterium]
MDTMMDKTRISRRGLLAGLGGLSFCVALGDGATLMSAAEAAENGKAFNAWVRIAPDGKVTIYSAGTEMGQGTMTTLPMILSEEMDADWSKVSIEMAPAEREVYGYTFAGQRDMAIVGSRATQLYFNDLRMAGAQVRKILIQNAAQKWNVDASTLRTEPGVVVNPASGARLAYGEIASFAAIPEKMPPVDPKELKARKDWRLIGKGVPRRDIPEKVNGTAVYAIDVQLPGMVYATTLHAPSHTGSPDSFNGADVKKMPGVIDVVKLSNGVAVVAATFPQAMAARAALNVTWNGGAAGAFDSQKTLDSYVGVHKDPKAQVVNLEKKGDTDAAFAAAAKVTKADFFADYGYHAQMEPLNAVVRIAPDGKSAEVWEGTQAPDASRDAVAQALGLEPRQVAINQCYMGGGFGRRTLGDYAAECATIAKAVGKPVKLLWTREEDMSHGMFRPQSFQCVEAAQDASGKVTGWKHCVVGDGGVLLHTGIKIPYYDVPNQNLERRGVSHGVRVKHWRAVGHVFNVFAIETMVDDMALAARMDPIEFRLKHMAATPKAKACFETVAKMCDWNAPRPEGRALGLSVSERSGSLGAGVVEISLDRDSGKIKVHKVWIAVDGGMIVTPGPAKANIESAIIYGLSGILHERISIKDGAVEQSNFHDYNLMRMSDMPSEMHVQFIDVDTRPTGLGEVGNPFIAAAIGNAFYRLTNKRLRHLPFTPERVKETLKA